MKIYKKLLCLYQEMSLIYLSLYMNELDCLSDQIKKQEEINLLRKAIVEEQFLLQQLVISDDYELVCEKILNDNRPFMSRLQDYVRLYNSTDLSVESIDGDETEFLKDLGKLRDAFSNNISKIYLSFLDDYIEKEKSSEIRKRLLELKYHKSFNNRYVEQTLLDCNFNVPPESYLDVYFVAETLGMDSETSSSIIFANYFLAIENTITQMLSLDDSSYEDFDKQVVSIDNQCMLLACISSLDSKYYKDIEDMISCKINKMSNDNNKISINLIYDILALRNKSKKRVKIVCVRVND